MAIKPILFNTEMTRAILDGRKGVTRRVVKPQPRSNLIPCEDGWPFRESEPIAVGVETYLVFRPTYRPGDTIYVRETFTKSDGEYYYRADFDSDFLDPCETLSGWYPYYCRYYPECIGCDHEPQRIHWRPSIHMPKEAARLFLRVTDVRVERLQDITPEQCIAEGVDDGTILKLLGGDFVIGVFDDLWNSTIKKADLPRYGWEANPYVWCVSFERITKEEAQKGAH